MHKIWHCYIQMPSIIEFTLWYQPRLHQKPLAYAYLSKENQDITRIFFRDSFLCFRSINLDVNPWFGYYMSKYRLNHLIVTRQELHKTYLRALSGISQKAFLSSLSITRAVIQIHKWVRNCNVSIEFIVQYCTQSVLLKAVEF